MSDNDKPLVYLNLFKRNDELHQCVWDSLSKMEEDKSKNNPNIHIQKCPFECACEDICPDEPPCMDKKKVAERSACQNGYIII